MVLAEDDNLETSLFFTDEQLKKMQQPPHQRNAESPNSSPSKTTDIPLPKNALVPTYKPNDEPTTNNNSKNPNHSPSSPPSKNTLPISNTSKQINTKSLKTSPNTHENFASFNFTNDVYKTLLYFRDLMLQSPSNAVDAPSNAVDVLDTVISKPNKVANQSSNFVNQTLTIPVIWTDKQLDHFQTKTPNVDAECEICNEKLVVLNKTDVQFLNKAFQQLDTSEQGYVTQEEMNEVLKQWKRERPNIDTTYFETHIIEEGGRIDYKKVLKDTINTNCCQTLCLCRPCRWIHNKCLTQKLTMGVNGTGKYLLRCGYCRASVWGTQYVQWLSKAQRLLKDAVGREKDVATKNAKQAMFLSVNTMHAVIQCGGGSIQQNPILGECLATVGSAIYKIQNVKSGGYPTSKLSGQICLMALEIGGAPSLRTAWILSEMQWLYKKQEQELEKLKWIDLAVKYCKEAKLGIPNSNHALQMRAECMLLEFQIVYPWIELPEVTQILQSWPWDINALNIDTCFLVCWVMVENFGARYMGKYYERGLFLDSVLFQDLTDELNFQVEDDNNCMKTWVLEDEKITNERCVVLGDMWMWDKKKLDGKVRERLSQAYNALEQHEKGSEWN